VSTTACNVPAALRAAVNSLPLVSVLRPGHPPGDDGLQPAVAGQPDAEPAAVGAGVPQPHVGVELRGGPQPGPAVGRAAGQLRVVRRVEPCCACEL